MLSTPTALRGDFVKIIGVDPGGTTGIAVIDVPWDENRFTPGVESHVHDDQLDATWGPVDGSVGRKISKLILEEQPDLIAIEKFIITQNTVRHSRQPDALWVIGGVRFLADIYGVPTHLQPPSLAKNTWDNGRLKETGWYDVVKRKHARDALRHALTACTTWKP